MPQNKPGMSLNHIKLHKSLDKNSKLSLSMQTKYVQTMFYIIANGLVSASHYNKTIRQELQGYPIGLTIKMQVLPNYASFVVQVTDQHTLKVIQQEHADVTVYFKHLQLAMLVLSFQESTTQAFANDRMTVDGDIGYATRFVRILNQLQALILPKVIAERAIKRYPDLSLSAKLITASRIYLSLTKTLVTHH